jgi:hypothetical protein
MSTGGKALGVVFSDQDFDNVTVAEDLTVSGTLTAASQAITGGQIGAASTSLVAFYGATVTTQPLAISSVTTAAITSVTTTAATSTTPYGYAAAAQADAIVATLNATATRAAALTTEANAIRAALATLGLTA